MGIIKAHRAQAGNCPVATRGQKTALAQGELRRLGALGLALVVAFSCLPQPDNSRNLLRERPLSAFKALLSCLERLR